LSQFFAAAASRRLSRGHLALSSQTKKPAAKEKQRRQESGSRFFRKFRVFDDHVFEFAGFEDFTAFLAFDEFGVFFASDDLDARMLARRRVASLLGGWGRRGWSHKSGSWVPIERPGISPEIGGILDRLPQLSSPSFELYFQNRFHSNFCIRSQLSPHRNHDGPSCALSGG
jgi:hypothetical protein